jgi:AmiR/NasT family two-component response regulator
MAELGSYRNVFDDQNEFNKLHDLILSAVQEFSVYRKGNLTYGEIMFVMECILDNMRGTSEKEAQGQVINGLEAPTFTTLLSIASRLVETMRKKGLIGSAEEAYVLHGDR